MSGNNRDAESAFSFQKHGERSALWQPNAEGYR
jgi:hypothetical protein